jgi:hypothetical protein
MGGDMVWIMTPLIRFAGRADEIIRPSEIPVSVSAESRLLKTLSFAKPLDEFLRESVTSARTWPANTIDSGISKKVIRDSDAGGVTIQLLETAEFD